MKKKHLLLLCSLLTFNYLISFAENQVSIFISPGLSFGHVHTDPDNAGFESNNVGFGGKVGALYGWNIKDNYYLCSGMVFVMQQIGFENGTKQTQQINERHKIQYLQIPVLVKLYTGEVALDLRCYATAGLIGAFKVNNWVADTKSTKPFITKLNICNFNALLGFGAEYQFSLSTSIFAGISYQLGLRTFFAAQQETPQLPTLYGYGHIITLDIGIVV